VDVFLFFKKRKGLGSGGENAELTAEAHAQVGTAPEQVGHGTTAGDVAAQPADIGHCALLADVGEGALVGVLEGTDLLVAAELLLALADLVEDLVALLVVLGQRLALGEVVELLLESLALGHGVEEAAEEGTLLAGDLGGGGVVGDGAVADGPDVVGAVHDEVFIDGEAAAGVGLGGELGHEVADDAADGVTGGPDEETVGDSFEFLGSVGSGDLGLDVLVGNLLDHGLGADGDRLLLEGRFGVVNQLLGEHGENVGESLDESDVEVVLDFGNPLLQVIVEEILKFTGEFDTSGATANHNHVQQALDLIVGLVLETGSLDTVHNTFADFLGVTNFLQEAGVLTNTGNTCMPPS
jgi:hypothetical protein